MNAFRQEASGHEITELDEKIKEVKQSKEVPREADIVHNMVNVVTIEPNLFNKFVTPCR